MNTGYPLKLRVLLSPGPTEAALTPDEYRSRKDAIAFIYSVMATLREPDWLVFLEVIMGNPPDYPAKAERLRYFRDGISPLYSKEYLELAYRKFCD